MRILELEIINFGKFNHETVTFHDGMNLIYGENEMGKTTLHSFIRGMFFGIEKQRGRAARKDEYSIREPWFHAGQFAESAEASCCSQAYKERRSSLTVKDSETSDSVIVSVFNRCFLAK